ncbi:MAG: ankyrin repeat domain-containing protein [Saccharospirillaceae bacterium]|nr:ankyrin repeat domain-containing protein [Pseudomonadales bacterium]NRB81256.1 ankyrin repeat domain-containing protein [Saccharospirillaceae bacterium]
MKKDFKSIGQTIVYGDFESFIKFVDGDNQLSRFNIKKLNVLHNASNIDDEDFNPKILEYIIKYGDLDINSKTNEGHTSLYLAIVRNNLVALKILLNAGANPNYKSDDGHSPLTLTFEGMGGYFDFAKTLLECGADPDADMPDWENEGLTFREAALKEHLEYAMNDNLKERQLRFRDIFTALKELLDEIPVGSRTNPEDNPVEIKESVKPENWTYKDIVELFVPRTGLADSKQGEMARVLGRLSHEYHNNGNINWDDSYVKLAGWLLQHLSDKSVFNAKQILQIDQNIQQIFNDAQTGKGAMSPEEAHYSRLKACVVSWCKQHPEKIEYNSGLPF